MAVRLRVLAPAKVNLTLEVLGRRADGYHEIASVMATCDLHDDVRVGAARSLDVRIRPAVGAGPGDDLVSRAARALAAATSREPHAHIHVRKRIPVAAGLGGGSSDAGAALRALAQLWGARADLAAIGASVGSDVPFFAAGHAIGVARGRGERITALRALDRLWISLVTRPERASTADVYAAVGGGPPGDGRATAALAELFRRGGATGGAVRALARNDLADAAQRVCPALAAALAAASRVGIQLIVSGSGPALFAVADDRAHAIRMSRALRREGLRARPRALGVAAPIVRL